MNKTGIEYLDYSWSPIAMRCARVSEGCKNCWHLRMADRLKGNMNFPLDVRRAYAGEGPPVLIPERLMKPARRKKPARIGVQFMGDLFHDKVVDSFIEAVFDIMVGSSQHTFQVLTKRPIRMRDFIQTHFPGLANARHIWVGVSAENQEQWDYRTHYLRQIPAAIRFVSIEPMLSAIDCRDGLRYRYPGIQTVGLGDNWPPLDWVIVGGESGPNARPMHLQWARDILDQCQASGTPYFFKQHGEWLSLRRDKTLRQYIGADGKRLGVHEFVDRPHEIHGDYGIARVGKKRAGHLLDGKEWREFPDGG